MVRVPPHPASGHRAGGARLPPHSLHRALGRRCGRPLRAREVPGAFGGKRVALLLMASGGGGTQLFDELPDAAVNVLFLYRLGWQLRSGSEFLGRLDVCFQRVRDDRSHGFELAGPEIAETKRYGAEACDGARKVGLGYIVEPAQASTTSAKAIPSPACRASRSRRRWTAARCASIRRAAGADGRSRTRGMAKPARVPVAPTAARPASRAGSAGRRPAPLVPLQRLQVLDKVAPLLFHQSQPEKPIVVVHHVAQRGEATVVVEAAFLMGPQPL